MGQQKSFVRRYVRPFIPFPKKRTLLRYFPSFETKNIGFILRKHGIDTVIDIGANKGQFALRLRSSGFAGRIISIEPNAIAHATLTRNARADRAWDVLPPLAIGDSEGSATHIIPDDDAMASLSPMLELRPTRNQVTDVKCLDKIWDDLEIAADARVAIKIDVQGCEHQVIAGAVASLKRAAAVLIEVSLIQIYAGEQNYLDVLSRLHERGFRAVFFSSVTNRKLYGEQYQTDVLLLSNAVALPSN